MTLGIVSGLTGRAVAAFGKSILISATFVCLNNTSVQAACKGVIRANAVLDFAARPASFLARFPNGGPNLANAIREFAAYDRTGLGAVRSAIKIANLEQKRAIGSGLAAAVIACLPRDGEVAKQIADLVKRAAEKDVFQGYLATADETSTPPPQTADDYATSRAFQIKPGEPLSLPPLLKMQTLVPELKKTTVKPLP